VSRAVVSGPGLVVLMVTLNILGVFFFNLDTSICGLLYVRYSFAVSDIVAEAVEVLHVDMIQDISVFLFAVKLSLHFCPKGFYVTTVL